RPEGAQLGLELRVDLHLLADQLGDRLAGRVVLGRADPAGHDDEVGALPGSLEQADDAALVVADLRDVVDVDPERRELLRQPGRVRVDDVPEQQLGTAGDDLGLHALLLPDAVRSLAARPCAIMPPSPDAGTGPMPRP